MHTELLYSTFYRAFTQKNIVFFTLSWTIPIKNRAFGFVHAIRRLLCRVSLLLHIVNYMKLLDIKEARLRNIFKIGEIKIAIGEFRCTAQSYIVSVSAYLKN